MKILLDYLKWHFFEAPRGIFQAIKNFLKFGIHYFSIPFLLKTFFSHWHKYKWEYPRSLDFGKILEVFLSNLISRIIGMISRVILILTWFFFEIFLSLISFLVISTWFLFPLIIILFFFFGFKFLLK